MVNLPTKFEVPSFTRYRDIKDVKTLEMGGLGWLETSILYRFRDTARYLSKFADFTIPHLHLAPPLGMTPSEF